MSNIIYDLSITGHHSEYISHLVDFILSNKKKKYIFLVSEELKHKFPEIIEKSKNNSYIKWEFVSEKKVKYIQDLPLIKRSFVEFKLLKDYTKRFNVTNVYMLYFNVFQLALIFKRPKFNITGILFLQFLRMPRRTFKEKIKYYRKFYITKFYSSNKKIKNVLILNDTATVNTLNHKFKTQIFKMLPDPIPLFEEEKGFNVFEYYNIPGHKKLLLHPGAIDPRKGTYEIIESIDLLSEYTTSNYAVLIVGRAKKNVESEILSKINSIKNKKFQIIFDNTFVTNERLKSLFLQSEVILMPYKNPEASSGILGHSILASKCVLAPNSGLIGEIIGKNNFGLLINDVTPKEIAKAIEKIKDFKMNAKGADKFVKEHSLNKFSETLLINN